VTTKRRKKRKAARQRRASRAITQGLADAKAGGDHAADSRPVQVQLDNTVPGGFRMVPA
jgi:hypothetical protein